MFSICFFYTLEMRIFNGRGKIFHSLIGLLPIITPIAGNITKYQSHTIYYIYLQIDCPTAKHVRNNHTKIFFSVCETFGCFVRENGEEKFVNLLCNMKYLTSFTAYFCIFDHNQIWLDCLVTRSMTKCALHLQFVMMSCARKQLHYQKHFSEA